MGGVDCHGHGSTSMVTCPEMNRQRARSNRLAITVDEGPVTVMPATPESGFRIPPPPDGFVANPSGRFHTTGKFVGDMVPVVPARRPDFFDKLAANARTNPACTIRRADQIDLDGGLDALDGICDLCIDGRFHSHP